MNEAWYRVAGMAFCYLAVLTAFCVVFVSLRRDAWERALWRRVRRSTPGVGTACVFRVISAEGKRLEEGQELAVPFEGTLGAASACDVCIPNPRVHLRSAFFWMEKDGLHMAPLHRDGFLVDGQQANPGDEAILRDGAELEVPAASVRVGAELRLGGLRLRLRMGAAPEEKATVPYVTKARQKTAGRGRGDGLGAKGRRETYAARKMKKTKRPAAQETPAAGEDEENAGKEAGLKPQNKGQNKGKDRNRESGRKKEEPGRERGRRSPRGKAGGRRDAGPRASAGKGAGRKRRLDRDPDGGL